jgi:hypothetical protein
VLRGTRTCRHHSHSQRSRQFAAQRHQALRPAPAAPCTSTCHAGTHAIHMQEHSHAACNVHMGAQPCSSRFQAAPAYISLSASPHYCPNQHRTCCSHAWMCTFACCGACTVPCVLSVCVCVCVYVLVCACACLCACMLTRARVLPDLPPTPPPSPPLGQMAS